MIEGCAVSNCVNIGRRSVFNYPVRFVEQTVIITVRHRFRKSDLDNREYEVVVDADIYWRLKAENRRIFIQVYRGGKWHRHELVRVCLEMREYAADRKWSLAWYVWGKRPAKGTAADHINGEDLDNRRENLRWATHDQNMQNRPGWNRYSSHPGISFKNATGKWCVSLNRSFDSLEEAEAFSQTVRNLVFGSYARRRFR